MSGLVVYSFDKNLLYVCILLSDMQRSCVPFFDPGCSINMDIMVRTGKKSWVPGHPVTKFRAMAPDVSWCLEWHLLHVIVVTCRILSWLQNIWKICAVLL